MIVRMLILLAALVPVPLAAQTTTKNVQDYLPLAVGNSWTYEHLFWDARSSDPVLLSTEFTLSILRTEVIDGHTYHVFSDVSTSLPEGLPRHFIAGKKLRWDGNNLMEHDGTSPLSLYRFQVAADRSNPIQTEYSISATHGDTLVKIYAALKRTNGLMYQTFGFYGHGQYSGRSVGFSEKFGLYDCLEGWAEGDLRTADNHITPVRAVFHTPGANRVPPVSVEWSDYECYFRGFNVQFNEQCNYPPTSNSPSSWGSVKDGGGDR